MASKFNYTAETILNLKFSPKEKGYDPLEVDKTYDGIISDYEAFNKTIEELSKANEQQKEEIKNLKEALNRSEFEVASLKKQLKALPQANSINEDNYSLLRKVAVYEKALYKKGVNPEKLLSDPDNC